MTTKNISRSGGGKAIASSAYRSGEKLKDIRSGESYDYTRRSGVVYSEIITPPDAPKWARSRESLWNEAEAAEKRKDARVAREIEVALPRELTREQQIGLVVKYAFENFVSDGMAADICVHDKGDGNPHAHVMLTTREITSAGWGSKGKESKNQTSWNKQETLERWREAWERASNAALELAGIDERVDRRTLKEQGADRMPQIHVGAYANTMPGSDRKAINEGIKRLNSERKAIARDIADLDRQLADLGREMSAAMPERQGAGWKYDTAGRKGEEGIPAAGVFESEPGTGNETTAAVHASPPAMPTTHAELEEYRDRLAARLAAEARKIARPEIAEAERRQIEADAKRIKAENAAIYESFCEAAADRDAHDKKEPPEPLLFGRGKWKLEHEGWEAQSDAKQRLVAGLWEKAGGDMGLKHTGYGKEEVTRRLTDGYALEEAKKIYDKSDEWKATLKNINDRAFLEAAQRDPEMKKALDQADREIAERETEERLDRRIAELDGKLNNPPYWIGSAGYPKREAAADARELLKLESMRLYDESGGEISQDDALKKAMERHPVVTDIERRLGRDRGMGR